MVGCCVGSPLNPPVTWHHQKKKQRHAHDIASRRAHFMPSCPRLSCACSAAAPSRCRGHTWSSQKSWGGLDGWGINTEVDHPVWRKSINPRELQQRSWGNSQKKSHRMTPKPARSLRSSKGNQEGRSSGPANEVQAQGSHVAWL